MHKSMIAAVIALITARFGQTCDENDCVWGVCTFRDTNDECVCLEGYEGENCNTTSSRFGRSDSFPSVCPCLNGGTCVYEGNMISGQYFCENPANCSYSCVCPPGFTGYNCSFVAGKTLYTTSQKELNTLQNSSFYVRSL